MDGQITIEDYLQELKEKNPDCTKCSFERIDMYCGLGMCRHPLVMNVHRKTRGKFSARYEQASCPAWCPIKDPERWEPWRK